VQSDPIGLEGGASTYLYAAANPALYRDPLGLLFGIDAGEEFGLQAAEFWAARENETGNGLYAIPGVLASMWTPCRSNDTFIDLLLAPAAGARALPALAKLLPKKAKGAIGEGMSIAKNFLEGNRYLGRQRPIPGTTSIADSAWASGSGAIYYVESKFGMSGLTAAQRAASKVLGSAYHIERWGYDWVANVGRYAGAAAGASWECSCQAQ